MKKAIVTGATGMIGSALIKQLVEKKIYVTAVVRPNSKKLNNLSDILDSEYLEIVACSMEDYEELPQLIEKHDYDTFFHFAWGKTYGADRDDVWAQEKNLKNSLMAVEVANKLGCSCFVGAGSQAEFGFFDGLLSDNCPKNPITGYGIAKLTTGRMTKLLCDKYGMRHVWGRILSVYGPGDNSFTMVMSAVECMSRGEHMAFTKGEQLWDYIYADDCARAFLLMGESGVHGKAYTVGSGNGRMLKDYIYQIRDAVNPSLSVGIGERDYYPNQVMKLVADLSELTKDTGFEPEISFEDGIKKTVEWYRNQNG